VEATSGQRDDVVRVALVDDHAVVRDGLAMVIGAADDLAVVAAVGTAAELLDELHRRSVDVCVMDLSLPDSDGLDLLERVRQVAPTLPVLVLTAHPESSYGPSCLRAGAAGFLNKSCEPDEIVRAIRSLARGLVYVAPELASLVVRDDHRGAPPHTRLSQRELAVLLRLASGRSNAEICRELHLNQRTVTTYRRRVLDKLGLATNADLVRYALEEGLVGVPPARPTPPS
jgi:DNA-binding NarL/FixJ family response regulator